jgi:hypothetical protein
VNERKDIYKVILFFLFSKLRMSEVIFFLFSKIHISEVILFSKLCTDYHLYESRHCLTGSHNLFIAYRTTKLFFTGAVELPAPHLLSPPSALHESTQEPLAQIREGERIWGDAGCVGEHDVYRSGCERCWRLYRSHDVYLLNAGREGGCAGDSLRALVIVAFR